MTYRVSSKPTNVQVVPGEITLTLPPAMALLFVATLGKTVSVGNCYGLWTALCEALRKDHGLNDHLYDEVQELLRLGFMNDSSPPIHLDSIAAKLKAAVCSNKE